MAAPIFTPKTTAELRAEREHVPVDDPLLSGEPGIEVTRDGRQRDVHDGAVEEGDPRTEHSRGDQPSPLRRRCADPRRAIVRRRRVHIVARLSQSWCSGVGGIRSRSLSPRCSECTQLANERQSASVDHHRSRR